MAPALGEKRDALTRVDECLGVAERAIETARKITAGIDGAGDRGAPERELYASLDRLTDALGDAEYWRMKVEEGC